MSGPNRGRLAVLMGGPWRLYTHPLPGWQMIGTVQRGFEIGALAKSNTGLYAQINAGAVRTLDQRKVKATISGTA